MPFIEVFFFRIKEQSRLLRKAGILVILAWAVEQLLATRHRVLRGVAVTVTTAVFIFNGVTAVPYLATQAPINDLSLIHI